MLLCDDFSADTGRVVGVDVGFGVILRGAPKAVAGRSSREDVRLKVVILL